MSAFILSGAPTVLMQLGAWGLMVGQRGEGEAVVDVVKVAFLGTEPCHRCQLIAEGTGKSQGDKMSFWELTGARLMNLRGEGVSLPERDVESPMLIFSMESLSRTGRSEKPPTPPPRDYCIS